MLLKKLSIIIFAMIFGLIISGCLTVTPIYYDDDKKAVRGEIKEFHKLYNNQKFKEMYQMMSPETKKVVKQELFVKRFETLFAEFGQIRNSEILEEEIKPLASVRVVDSIYETEFEQGKVKESFVVSTNKKRTFIEIYNQSNKDSLESTK